MKGGKKKQNILFFLVLRERRREREGESSNFSLLSTEIGWSKFVRPRVKFIYSTRATRGYKKRRGFIEDPREEISGNQNFRD